MSERRIRRAVVPGWFSSVAGAIALVTVGFGLGLFAGLTFEDPDLVIGHLAGQTQLVKLMPGPPDRFETEAVAQEADPPLGARSDFSLPPAIRPTRHVEAPVEPSEQPRARRRPLAASQRSGGLADVAAPPPGLGFVIQVGAFSDSAVAERLQDRLQGLGLPSYLERAQGNPWTWRVRVGPFGSEGEAARVAGRLKREEKLPTWVLRNVDG